MEYKSGTLFIVATPIGNLEDITFRALRILKEVDLIAAEDTRQTLRLLNHFEIKKPLISCHDINEAFRGEEIIRRLSGGESVALVSDAGTPGISDPGEILVRMAIEAGISITMAPGPVAAVMGLVLSGLSTSRFCFEGFLPHAKRDRIKILESLRDEERTLVFYESPHRLASMLEDVRTVLGDRSCALARELTKLYEEIQRGSISGMLAKFDRVEPRGEYVVVIESAPQHTRENAEREDWLDVDVFQHISIYEERGLDRMEAMKKVAKDRGLSKRDIYALVQSRIDKE
jgi:16S rRNA (cytidine1402-2'-O)-methyltransferase